MNFYICMHLHKHHPDHDIIYFQHSDSLIPISQTVPLPPHERHDSNRDWTWTSINGTFAPKMDHSQSWWIDVDCQLGWGMDALVCIQMGFSICKDFPQSMIAEFQGWMSQERGEGHKPGTQVYGIMARFWGSISAYQLENIITDISGKYNLPHFLFHFANGIL